MDVEQILIVLLALIALVLAFSIVAYRIGKASQKRRTDIVRKRLIKKLEEYSKEDDD